MDDMQQSEFERYQLESRRFEDNFNWWVVVLVAMAFGACLMMALSGQLPAE